MKRLIFFFILISSACIIKAQQEKQNFSLTGIWVFEKAEYMELTPQSQKFQVIHGINSEEGLYAYSNCSQEVVKMAIFYSEEVAAMGTLFESYLGKCKFITQPPSSDNKQSILKFGGLEDLGKDSPVQGLKYSAPDIEYKIEYVDENTIGIILEKGCVDENLAITQTAIKCILKREM